jgi:hypothetical protein
MEKYRRGNGVANIVQGDECGVYFLLKAGNLSSDEFDQPLVCSIAQPQVTVSADYVISSRVKNAQSDLIEAGHFGISFSSGEPEACEMRSCPAMIIASRSC